ncbi:MULTISPECIES: ABC transporter ATP-binding protein [Shewanella]|uniref:ABC transporter ATP-binding protein n=1 Tax=Shewanella TaxID=22 RepID=UPI0004916A9A|nr:MULTISPECIES: ABC transporter ATP-binding protein [Shewanella]QLE84197.1 ABC transporter ATP-binding protein [Shewanella sp. Scap07]
MSHAIVELNNLSKSFMDGEQQHQVLNQVNFVLNKADSVALTGASGCGKSTLLNLIAGFEPLSSGQIILRGEDTQQWQDKQWSRFRHQQLGVVFQQFNLLTPIDVKHNIVFPLSLNGHKWNDWCDHLVTTLGLGDLLSRHVQSLSGGQQQRVAIARALAHQPALLLADEPTGNLDQQASMEVMQLMTALTTEQQTSVLMVTHSEECAAFMQRRCHVKLGTVHE